MAVPEAPAAPRVGRYARWAAGRLPRSRRWILAAVACTLVLVSGVSGILWRQHSLRTIPGPAPSAGMQDQHPAESGLIRKALAEERWVDALDGIPTLRSLAPSDARLPDWERKAAGGLERLRQIDAIRSSTSDAIQSKDWKAAEKGLDELVKAAPNDPQVLSCQKLLREGKQEELIAAENSDREQRISSLRAAIVAALANREWKGARKNIDELLKLAPSDRSIVEWQDRIDAGLAEELQISTRTGRPTAEPPPTLPDPVSVGSLASTSVVGQKFPNITHKLDKLSKIV